MINFKNVEKVMKFLFKPTDPKNTGHHDSLEHMQRKPQAYFVSVIDKLLKGSVKKEYLSNYVAGVYFGILLSHMSDTGFVKEFVSKIGYDTKQEDPNAKKECEKSS